MGITTLSRETQFERVIIQPAARRWLIPGGDRTGYCVREDDQHLVGGDGIDSREHSVDVHERPVPKGGDTKKIIVDGDLLLRLVVLEGPFRDIAVKGKHAVERAPSVRGDVERPQRLVDVVRNTGNNILDVLHRREHLRAHEDLVLVLDDFQADEIDRHVIQADSPVLVGRHRDHQVPVDEVHVEMGIGSGVKIDPFRIAFLLAPQFAVVHPDFSVRAGGNVIELVKEPGNFLSGRKVEQVDRLIDGTGENCPFMPRTVARGDHFAIRIRTLPLLGRKERHFLDFHPNVVEPRSNRIRRRFDRSRRGRERRPGGESGSDSQGDVHRCGPRWIRARIRPSATTCGKNNG